MVCYIFVISHKFSPHQFYKDINEVYNVCHPAAKNVNIDFHCMLDILCRMVSSLTQ